MVKVPCKGERHQTAKRLWYSELYLFEKKVVKTKFKEEQFISYLVCHMDKYHRADVIGIERENERDESYKSTKNPQIDSTRTSENYHIIERSDTYLTYIDKRIKELAPKRKIKDDAVLINSFILGSDGEFFNGLSPYQQQDFFFDCTKFFADRYGAKNIISAVVHNDETTPHLHLNLIPVLDGRLCSKQLFDRKSLRALQTDFHEAVGKKWGLKRGEIGSMAEHLDTTAFKLKKIKEETVSTILQQADAQAVIDEAEKVRAEIAPAKALLEDYDRATSAGTPFSGRKKDTEIIALRTKNGQLEREITTRGKDNSDLFQQLQKAIQTNDKMQPAYEMVGEIMSVYPDEFEELLQRARTKKNTPTPFRRNANGSGKGGK